MSIVNPTPSLSLERQIVGSNSNVWGDRENANWARVDQSQRSLSVDVSSGSVTLTQADTTDLGADAQTRYAYITATGTPGAPAVVVWPAAVVKMYVLANATSQPVTFKVAGLTGLVVQPGGQQLAYCATDMVSVGVSSSGLATVVANLATEVSNRTSADTALIADYTARVATEATARSTQATNLFNDYVARDAVLSSAKLNKPTFARSVPGYTYYADTGHVVQWGSGVTPNGGHYTSVAFPVAFPTNCFSVVVTEANSAGWESGGETGTPTLYGIGDRSATQFAINSMRWETNQWYFRSTAYNYIAVGG